MGVVGYRCPASGEAVTTAIRTSRDTLVRMRERDLTIWVWCPHCLAGHKINPAEARLEGEVIENEVMESEAAEGGFATLLGNPSLAGA
jgi:hypothetical protein